MRKLFRHIANVFWSVVRFWRRLLPVRVIVRIAIMLMSLPNVQAQQLQIESMYVRLRQGSTGQREADTAGEPVKTEEKK